MTTRRAKTSHRRKPSNAPNKNKIDVQHAAQVGFLTHVQEVLRQTSTDSHLAASKMFNLGLSHYLRNANEYDKLVATKLFEKSAKMGLARAQLRYAMCLWDGYGIEKNLSEALKWFEAGAMQGCAKAQFNVAIAYLQGLGVERDEIAAAWWFEQAIAHGLDQAHYNLGIMYQHGVGVPRCEDTAATHFAAAGYAPPPCGHPSKDKSDNDSQSSSKDVTLPSDHEGEPLSSGDNQSNVRTALASFVAEYASVKATAPWWNSSTNQEASSAPATEPIKVSPITACHMYSCPSGKGLAEKGLDKADEWVLGEADWTPRGYETMSATPHPAQYLETLSL